MDALKQFLVTFVVFMVVDLIWLGVVAKKLYAQYLGYIMAESVNWIAAFSFYILFVIGIVFFVVNPAIQKESWVYALTVGAFFGLLTYATYDLTNLATLKDWPLTITIIDLIWGTFLSSTTATVSYFILRALK